METKAGARHEFWVGKDGQESMIMRGSSPMTWRDITRCWQFDWEFQEYFISMLKQQPFESFFWEMPPVCKSSVDNIYKFVIVDAGTAFHSMKGDPNCFKDQFPDENCQEVIAFNNLAGDAVLVVPRPPQEQKDLDHYLNLASFMRCDSATQVMLLQELGKQVEQWLQSRERFVFVSTAGLGVPWLHVRLDTCPKYYRHMPYKKIPENNHRFANNCWSCCRKAIRFVLILVSLALLLGSLRNLQQALK